MRAVFYCAAMVLVLLASQSMAQQLVPRPDPIGGAKADVRIAASDVFANVPPAERWRYRWADDRWWYRTPGGRWMWYSNDQGWLEFNSPQRRLAADPIVTGVPPYDGYYYQAPPYAPGVVTDVRPYGGVNVGVGRRIGVDVCGPHGSVRVGRIFVGW